MNPRRKRTSEFTPTTRAAERLGPACGLWPAGEERPVGAGWAEGRVGRKVGRAESEEKRISELKIGFFEFIKALEICTRIFRRNFDMRIFPKFF
jgi:hypothetical protein